MDDLSAQTKRFLQRLRYGFDLTMAAGPLSVIGWLAVASLIVILFVALFLATTHIAPPDNHDGLSFVEAFWEATMRTIDTGNVGGDNGWAFRVVMLAVTLWGIFVVSTLIGLMSAGVQSQLDVLRKGRSFVLERNHTVILNWSNSIFDIIKELVVAHAKDRRFSIVVLADKDKVEMEDEIAIKVGTHRHARIVCRSGDPGDLSDLEIVNLEAARSIVVLANEADDADAQNIKIVLALVHGPERRADRYQISAEFRTAKCAQIARDIGNGEVQAVVPDDLISRVIVHSSRHAGLSAVYSELLDFEGCEFYAIPEPALAGKTYGEAIALVDPGALIGLCDAQGVHLNPTMDTVIGENDLAVIIADDRESIAIAAQATRLLDETALRSRAPVKEAVERALVLGWNRRGPEIARQLSLYMAAGSEITIAAATPTFEQDMSQLRLPKPGIALSHTVADTRDRHALEALGAASYDRTIVLSCSDALAPQAADTQTLVTLLHLREIATASGKRGILVSEMADIRNRQLAAVTRADDFVVSNRLVSLMLAQASESEFTSAIFKDLLDEDGSEIYMRPVDTVVATEKPVDFHTIIEACRRRGETAFGTCRPRGDKDNPSGVTLNPSKGEPISYKAGDFIVVLARE